MEISRFGVSSVFVLDLRQTGKLTETVKGVLGSCMKKRWV